MQFGTMGALGGMDLLLRQMFSFLASSPPASPLEAARQILWFLPLAHQLKGEMFTQVVTAPTPAADTRRLAMMAQLIPAVNRRIEVLLYAVGRSRRARREATLALRLAEQIHRGQEAALARVVRLGPDTGAGQDAWLQLASVATTAPTMHSRLEGLAAGAAQIVLRSYGR